MNRRDALTRLVKSMFAILALAFLFVLFRSVSGPSRVSDPNQVFDDVQSGQTALRRYQGKRVWATRLSALQRNQLRQLDELLVDASTGCALSTSVCAVLAATARDGIEIIYSDVVPPQLASGTPWYGGLVDPTTGAVYDRLGRRYRGAGGGSSTSLESLTVD